MQATRRTSEKGTDHNRPTTDPIALFREVEHSRVTVRRVREALEGNRDPKRVKQGDWFTAIEYVREEAGVELVLYHEQHCDDSPDTAAIVSLHDNGLWSIVAGYNDVDGRFLNKVSRWDIEESFRFHAAPTVLPLAEAKDRLKAFVAEH